MNKPFAGARPRHAQPELRYLSADPEHRRLAEEATTCCLCGTDLAFAQEFDFETLTVKESSECPSCRIRTKPQAHPLQ